MRVTTMVYDTHVKQLQLQMSVVNTINSDGQYSESATSGGFDYLALSMFSERPQSAGQLLRTQHSEILTEFEQVRNLASAGSSESLNLRNSMTRVAGRISMHMQLERGVVAKQMASDPRSRALSDQFERDMVPLRAAILDWLKRFSTPSLIASHLAEFKVDSEKLFRDLEERFRQEERDLFPEFERLVGGSH